MGIFHEQEEVINRTTEQLMVTYDGQRIYLKPNYNAKGELLEDVHNLLPKIVIPYALNQNVIMGSEEFTDPSDFKSKIGVVRERRDKKKLYSWNDCTFLGTPSAELTRVSQAQIMEESIADPKAKIEIRGKMDHRNTDASMNKNTAPFDLRES